MLHWQLGLFPLLVLGLGTTSVSAASPRRTALPASEAAASFQLHPDLRIELVAAEPEVIDPVTAAFDHLGRLWVVEMNDYPTAPPGEKPIGGKIKLLSDEDGDGYYETAVVFADSLMFPTGIAPFRDGVIATLAGQVVYLADTTGDGRCDHREQWFTGFSEDNEQLRANHPTWTLENEIHIASGLRGGEVRSADPRWPASEQSLSLAARDFRFAPFGGNYRAVAGNSQFGFYQDDAGRNFVCSNRNPCRLLLADADQVATNPLLPLAQWIVDVMPAAEESQVFPLVDAWTTSNLHAGQFTAACGVYRYQSDWLSPWLKDDFFACEPTGSLVQRYRQAEDGIVPTAVRGRANVEFLASHDPWFRPVDLLDGPDGAMYVVDMHRAVIEHPQWMPKELQNREDQRWGDAQGRIFRIAARDGEREPNQRVDFQSASTTDLVAALANDNRWARTTAARRLAEKAQELAGAAADVGAKDDLAAIVSALQTSLSADVPGRAVVRALWLLQAMEQLTSGAVSHAAKHPDASVRVQATRLLARHRDDWPDAKDLLDGLANDADPRVRYQWLLELAPLVDSAWVDSLASAVRGRPADSATDRLWIARALSLTNEPAAVPVVQRLLTQPAGGAANDESSVRVQTMAPLIKRLGWSGNAETLKLLLSAAEASPSDAGRELLLDEFASGLAQRGLPWSALTADLPTELQDRLQERLDRDRQRVQDPSQPLAQRTAALQRVGLDRSPQTRQLCEKILENESEELYIEAIGVAVRFDDPALASLLVDRLLELPPRSAGATVSALVTQGKWTPALVDALSENQVPWGLIDPASLRRLERHPDRSVAERVKALLASRTTEDRGELLSRYSTTLGAAADPHAGRELFVRHCAACHRIDGQGVAVGPDISDLRTQTPEQLLVAILDPNAVIDANYYRYLVLTEDGQVIEGLLEDSNQQSVTLRLQEGVQRTIPRSQVEQLRASGVSMMPEGFEQQLTPEAMRDLIAYLKRWRLLSNEIPLSGP